MQKTSYDIAIFLIAVAILTLLLVAFIIAMLYLYRRKQITYSQDLDRLILNHEKNLLQSQIEVQEQTFNHISREIHDNISLSLTLAKLNLITVRPEEIDKNIHLINTSIDLIGKSITDLSDISRSMNADTVFQQGLFNALKNEADKIQRTGLIAITNTVNGDPIFMDSKKELVTFRIIQEALNNILKHSKATEVKLDLHYNKEQILITIADNGIGFDLHAAKSRKGTGLNNMKKRAETFNGNLEINTSPGNGTTLLIIIPI
jgi:two-component system, NarL family, sensor kinase